jgi:YD repeat-containing protein
LPRRAGESGFVLIALIALLAMGGLYFFISNLTPEAIEARRQAKTEAALMQAREALIGYAISYRDKNANRMYGFLPMPDIGKRGTTTDEGCKDSNSKPLEGCQSPPSPSDIAKVEAGNDYLPTLVGRFPWRTLGMPPLRDGHGECLWLIVSSLALSGNATGTTHAFNWDTLGYLDVQTANGDSALQSLYAGLPHNRPWAIIYAPGHPLADQIRSNLGGDDVSECGGNYDARNYLDPYVLDALGSTRNSLANAHHASDDSNDDPVDGNPNDFALRSSNPIKVTTGGKIYKSGASYLSGGCAGSDCNLLANDIGLTLTGDALFGAIRKNANFRTDINSMLSAIERCLNKEVAKWDDPSSPTSPRPFDFEPLVDNTSTPLASPTGKKVGRLKTCFSDADDPKGYFSHYRDQVFLAGCDSGTCITATIDGANKNCAGVIVFGGQRTATQSRTASLESFVNDAGGGPVQVQQRNNPTNYLEGINLDSFKTTGSNPFEGFIGDSEFRAVAYPQDANKDIVRCITGEKPFTPVPNPNLASDKQLTTYDPTTGTLTLGSVDVTTSTYPAAALYGCSWTPTAYSLGSGMRLYYRFNILNGGDGYVFAMIDGDRNSGNPCGAARQHLGYSGENADTPYLDWPKLGVEFDTRSFSERNNYSEIGDPLSNGRSDPCYRAACGNPTQNLDYDSHVAIVYWGNQAAAAGVTTPRQDDNVHGFPTPPDISTRPAPRNPVVDPWPNPAVPAIPGGVTPLNRLSDTTQTRDFHVRVELTRISTNAANRSTTYKIQTWVVAESITAASQIAAMKTTSRPMNVLYPTLAPLVQDTPTVYDIQGGLCSAGCGPKEVCNSTDGMCYQPAFKNVRLGFTNAQSSRDQVITISDFVPTWIP